MTEIQELEKAVDNFALHMKKRLRTKYQEGYRGWKTRYPTDKLMLKASEDTVKILTGHSIKKHCIDVANRMMMIWFRHIV